MALRLNSCARRCERPAEREQVVSALMPFRGSFYEHFGYGFVERRSEWTLPLPVLPHGGFEGIQFYQPGDLQELVHFRQRVVERGQCDIERPIDVWGFQLKAQDGGGVCRGGSAIEGWADPWVPML